MKKIVILLLISIALSPSFLMAQTSEEKRRVEEGKRESLQLTETHKPKEEGPPVQPIAPIDIVYFAELLPRRVAFRYDACKAFVVLMKVENQYIDLNSQIVFLKEKSFLPKKFRSEFDPMKPLRKGLAAYMFCKALNIKGGISLRLFGMNERYAVQEVAFEGIMPSGNVNDIVSGQELVSALMQAANYMVKKQEARGGKTKKRDKVRNLLVAGIAFLVVSFLSGIAMGQTSEERRRIMQEKLKALEKTELKILEGEDRLMFDYGGWINFRADNYNEDDNDTSTVDALDDMYSLDSRFWIKATLKPPVGASYKNEHSCYIRIKDIHDIERRSDDDGDYDHDGPHLDYAYLVLDVRPYWLEIGRRYFSVGQGIAYSNVSDGVELLANLQDWNLKALVSHTLPHEDNIDSSVPGWGKGSDRTYLGVEATYLGIPDHGIYGYFLMQKDDSEEWPGDDTSHDYTYDSEYFGLGSQGKILPSVHYWAEIIWETGKSYIFDSNEKKDVDAWGGDFGISYDADIYSHPNFSFEYAFGSGDADRSSVTDTVNGNASGDDKNFLYFGYLPAGYALSPRLSNLHFYKAGVLLKPLEMFRFFRNLSVGADYYQYWKDKEAGGIYDGDATISDDDIGSEIDLRASWQILSDLSCSLEYGYFMPGDAYADSADDPENYFLVTTTFTF